MANAALEAGVDAYLVKPIAVESLREAIADSLLKREARAEVLEGDGSSAVDEKASELESMLEMLEGTLSAVPAGAASTADSKTEVETETQTRLNILMGKISDQLADFVTSYDTATPEKLRVMQLHLDFMDAIRNGRTDLVSHESSNMIIDGLKMAIDMASD
ncbi:MAG: hypothetical protein CL569_10785 [Alphaproteobacteria bacterium]|nr:hypothetical protein [Alphaproteobacteria bacterium]